MHVIFYLSYANKITMIYIFGIKHQDFVIIYAKLLCTLLHNVTSLSHQWFIILICGAISLPNAMLYDKYIIINLISTHASLSAH